MCRAATTGGQLVLQTDFETADGTARVIDFMPPREGGAPQLVCIVQGLRGRVPMRMLLPESAHISARPSCTMIASLAQVTQNRPIGSPNGHQSLNHRIGHTRRSARTTVRRSLTACDQP